MNLLKSLLFPSLRKEKLTGAASSIRKMGDKVATESSLIKSKLRNLTDTNIKLGISHARRGYHSDACFRYRMTSFFDKNLVDTYYHWARSLIRMDEFDRALEKIEFALSLDPKYIPALYTKAKIENPDDIMEVPNEVYKVDHEPLIYDYGEIENAPEILGKRDYMHALSKRLIRAVLKHVTDKNPQLVVLDIEAEYGDNAIRLRKKEVCKSIHATSSFAHKANRLEELSANDEMLYESVDNLLGGEFLDSVNKKFDLILMNDGMQQYGDFDHILPLFKKRLKAKGLVAFTTYHNTNEGTTFNIKGDYFSCNPKHVIKQFESQGFKLLKTEAFECDVEVAKSMLPRDFFIFSV